MPLLDEGQHAVGRILELRVTQDGPVLGQVVRQVLDDVLHGHDEPRATRGGSLGITEDHDAGGVPAGVRADPPYFFCSEHCAASFEKDPRKYAGTSA